MIFLNSVCYQIEEIREISLKSELILILILFESKILLGIYMIEIPL